MRLALTLAVVAGALAGARPARATPTSRLVYSRSSEAGSCPDEAALRKAVATRVGYDPFFAYATRTIVTSVVRRHEDFVATVDLVDESGMSHGARELRAGSDCGALLDAVALAIAIAIDPQSLSRPSAPPAPSPPPEPEPPPPTPATTTAPPPEVEPPPPAPPRTTRPPALEASLGILALAGTAPEPTVGVAIGAGVRWRRFSLGIEGVIDAPAGTADAQGASASSWLTYGAVVPCVHLGPLFGCALAEAGAVRSSGGGEPGTLSTWLPWLAAGGRVGVLIPLDETAALRFHGDLVADLDPITLELNGDKVWKPPPVAGSTGADLVLHFP